jgi:uncharacterized protein YkwD
MIGRRIAAAIAAALLATACESGQTDTGSGSNTNWLRGCNEDTDCGDSLGCRCGSCTLDCSEDDECQALGAARCVPVEDGAAWAACQSREPALSSGMCLPSCAPGDCAEGACVNDACVPLVLPNSEFCGPVARSAPDDQTGADQLLALVNSRRASGGIMCGDTAMSASVAPLRLDSRLVCAARVFAADRAATPGTDLTDSLGRGTEERLSLAGYEQLLWGESFARAESAEAALDSALSDADICARLMGAAYLDIGVARSSGVYVVTIAAE